MKTEIELLFQASMPSERGAMQDIYLVHGFLHAKHWYYRQILEGWVTQLAKIGNTPATALVFRFDCSSILASGLSGIEGGVWRFRSLVDMGLVRETMGYGDVPSPGSNGPFRVQHEATLTNKDQQSERKLLIISHGLGSWLIKDALAHPSASYNVISTYGRVEIMLVDSEIENSYSEFINRTRALFNFNLSAPYSPEDLTKLYNYLQRVDENFNLFRDMCHDLGGDPGYPGAPKSLLTYRDRCLMIWMSDDRSLDPNELAWTSWFSRLLPIKRVEPTVAEVIRKLPNIQEVMRQPDLRPITTDISETPQPFQESTTPKQEVLITSTTTPLGGDDASREQPTRRPDNTIDPFSASHVTNYSSQTIHPTMDSDSLAMQAEIEEFEISNSQIQSAYREAVSFLEMGELDHAALLFARILEHQNLEDQPFQKLCIRINIVVVKMYRGYYGESRKDFLCIMRELEVIGNSHQSAAEARYICQLRLAKCRLVAGQWEDAVTEILSILKNNPKRSQIQLHKDLALAYAHLGEYSEARNALKLAQEEARFIREMDLADIDTRANHSAQRDNISTHQEERAGQKFSQDRDYETLREKQRTGLKIREKIVQFAAAEIDMLAGDYTAALATSSDTLDFMKKTLGAKHLKTLATATLKAWCLAYSGRYVEAESLSLATYRISSQVLGRSHPQTLDTMGCLVHVFRHQARFAEAINTGLSLDSLSTEWVRKEGGNHPQAIHAKFLLAMAYHANGDYVSSNRCINTVVDQAEESIGMRHSDTLRYKSEKARIILSLGNISEASSLASLVASQQFEAYMCSEDTCRGKLGKDPRQEGLSYFNKLIRPSSGVLHPFLSATLQLLADIEVRKYRLPHHNGAQADLNTAMKILMKIRSSYSKMEAQSGVFITYIDRDLATLYKERNAQSDRFSKTIELLGQVHENMKSHMGEHHPDTLGALRELTIAQCLRGFSNPSPELFSRERVNTVSYNVLKTLQSCLGPFHPEVLASQLWYLAVNLLSQSDGDSRWDGITQDLVKSLSDPNVVKERLVESYVIKRKVAGFLVGASKFQKALVLVDGSISELGKVEAMEENQWLRKPLSDLRTAFLKLKQNIEELQVDTEV